MNTKYPPTTGNSDTWPNGRKSPQTAEQYSNRRFYDWRRAMYPIKRDTEIND